MKKRLRLRICKTFKKGWPPGKLAFPINGRSKSYGPETGKNWFFLLMLRDANMGDLK